MSAWIKTLEDFKYHVRLASRQGIVFLDTETTGLDPYTMRLLLISMRYGTTSVVLDITALGYECLNMFGTHVLGNPNVVKVFHNAVFDMKVLYHFCKMVPVNCECTEIAERIIHAGAHALSCSLKATATRRLGVDMDKEVRDEFIGFVGEIEQHHIDYSQMDVDVLEGIYGQQQEEIDRYELRAVYEMEMDILEATMMMEYEGVCINEDRLRGAVEPFRQFVKKADKAIQDEILKNGLAKQILFSREGYSAVNTSSNAQMLEVVNGIGIDVKNLNAKTLAEWDARYASKGQPIAEEEAAEEDEISIGYAHPFLKLHGARVASEKILGTYVEGLLQRINPVTKRIHPSFRQCGAMATGRYSSQNPNFQNLPKLDKLSALGMQNYDIRSMFVPAPGNMFIICDYSSIELVIAACFSEDEVLLEQMRIGDAHSPVATALFGIEVNAKNKKIEPYSILRDCAKTTTYAILYGTSGINLERTLSTKLARCGVHVRRGMGDEWIHRWHGLFPTAGRFLEQNANYAVTRGYVTTVMGRRRNWNTRFQHKQAYHAARREGSNSAIQGSSADMIKQAIRVLYPALDPSQGRIVGQIHDELLLEAKEEYVHDVAALAKYHMEEEGCKLFPIGRKYGIIQVEPKISNCYDK